MQHIPRLTQGINFGLIPAMKITDIYNKHARRLCAAADAGRPFAVLTYGPDCETSHFRTFATKGAADIFLKSATGNGTGGCIAETSVQRRAACAFYIPPVTGFRSFP